MLSLRPEPTVVCCNGVCNARILSIVSIPNLPGKPGTPSSDWRAGWLGWPDQDWTSDGSPQSAGRGPLHIEPDSSEDEEEEDEEVLVAANRRNVEEAAGIQVTNLKIDLLQPIGRFVQSPKSEKNTKIIFSSGPTFQSFHGSISCFHE